MPDKFDPSSYLAQADVPEGPFDPETYLRAADQVPPTPQGPKTSLLEAVAAGLSQVPFGLGDEAGALLQAGASPPEPGAPWYAMPNLREQMKVYRQARSENRVQDKAASSEHPWAYYPALLAGSIATGPLLPGGGAKGLAGLAKLKALAKPAAAIGALTGLGSGDADLTRGEVGKAALQTGMGGTAGLILGTSLPYTAGALGELASGLVQPTEAAKFLQSKGVDLTLGQMAAGTRLAQLEEVSQSGPLGKLIEGQRAKGLESWQRAAMNEALPPGATPSPEGATLAERMAALKQGITRGYDALKDEKLWADIYKGGGKWRPLASEGSKLGAFDSATQRGQTTATQATRDAVKDFLDNQLTTLKPRKSDMKVSADQLHQMRSNIREAIRERVMGNPNAEDRAAAKMLKKAEEAVTETLEQQLPEGALAALQGADAQYGKFKTLSKAMNRANLSPNGFTPAQLAQATKSGSNADAFASGGGGPLRELAEAGRATLDQRSPPTGARLLAVLPGLRHPAGAMAAFLNTPAGKRIALGDTTPQKIALTVADWLEQQGLSKALRSGTTAQGSGGATQFLNGGP